MSAALAVILKKIALILATDKRFWTAVLSVIIGVILLIVLLFGAIFSIFSAGAKHNTDLINLIFKPELPIESLLQSEPQYYYHIKAAREHLAEVKTEADKINTELLPPEGGSEENKPQSIDILKAQVIYYVLFLESTAVTNLPPKADYIACFYTKTGDIFSVIADESAVYKNIETLISRPIIEDEKKRITEIYNKLTDKNAFINFDGEYCPPIEIEYFNSITSPFGTRIDPITGRPGAFHNGTDFSWGGCYGANIYAAGPGTVTRASDVGDGFGKCVVIDHGGGIQTYYAHCSSITAKVGDTVTKGQYIGQIGSTGRSTGPHLHFGLEVNGSWQDAMSLFQASP